jgi:hypothetical protein
MLKKIAIIGILGLLLSGCEREEPRPVETPTAPPPATEPAPGTAVEPTDPEDEVGDRDVTEEPATEEPATQTQNGAPPPDAADVPGDMTFEARNGNVAFPHQAHAAMFDCSSCHEQTPPGAIPNWGRDVAHALCIECHKAEGAGPVACNECHVRN